MFNNNFGTWYIVRYKNLLKFLKIKVASMKIMNKKCILLIDKMVMKQCLEFSIFRELIEGCEDLEELRRREVMVKQALIIMRGIYSAWKILCLQFWGEINYACAH